MSFHLYDINELYSNADGSVQFIEMAVGNFDDESFWQGESITVTQGLTTHSFTFASNLPSTATANSKVLIATQGFADLGIVTPNFIVPAGFLFTSGGGTVNFAGVDSVTYTTLPLDGSLSLNHSGATAVNSPTNFAGMSGTVIYNLPPVVSLPLPDQVTGAEQSYSLLVPADTFTDPNDDTLSYSAALSTGAVLPSWLTFNATAVTLSGTPGTANVGTINISLTASDGHGGTASDSFALTILSGNVLSGTTGADSLTGSGGDDNISGAGGDDTLGGGVGNDTLLGGAGNDGLDGGAGADWMYGGTGDDTYYVDGQPDLVFENPGEGSDTVIASASFYMYAGIEKLILASGAGDIFGSANELDNTLTGNEGVNLLLGWDGADTISGGGGNDVIYGVNGNDSLLGDAGIDVLVAGDGNDALDGGSDPDLLFGESGNDVLYGGTGFATDILVGGSGEDVLDGSASLASGQVRNEGDYDLMYGGTENDTYYVDTPADLTFETVADGGGGTDTVIADITGAGYYLYADVENLELRGNTPYGVGNELDNTLAGSNLSNWLLGGAGNDTLNGKGGGDVLFGEAGSDTFVFERGTGGDVVGDFAPGVDKLKLVDVGYTSFADLNGRMVEGGNAMAIDLGAGDFVVLHNVTIASLSAGDFIFA